MADKEYTVIEIVDVLRRQAAGDKSVYVLVTHKQDLPALICGIEEAWEYFGGVTRRLISTT